MFWDRVACIYDLFTVFYNTKVHKNICSTIAALIAPADEVLECACGTGMLTVCIAPRCARLQATDISQNMLKRAAKKCRVYPNISFGVVDISQLEYSDEQFDKVVAANVIHLLDKPYKALKELERVCRSGGKIIIPTYLSGGAADTGQPVTVVQGKPGKLFKRQFTYRSYQQFFADAGYTNAEYILIEGSLPCGIAIITK